MINSTQSHARYDSIGHGYSSRRREDPILSKKIVNALGNARTVINVGAGTGSYEPSDRVVIPVEPSEVMIRQRPASSLPAIRATAEALPFHDKVVDAAMTVLSLHHWDPYQAAGLREMKRVARDCVIVVTIDPRVSGKMWLMADYLREVAALDNRIFPLPETISEWLECETEIEIVPISRETPDGTLMSFWAHPERVLDEAARAATSGFARQTMEVVKRVVSEVGRDLQNGRWDERNGHLRRLYECDVGLRIITAKLR
ncbi:MAG: methyltransferase domain-containing protein [Proteobacteria bacterium]|nr:methyltransferase domain-containing protein [Pseudomonadota bacterium]